MSEKKIMVTISNCPEPLRNRIAAIADMEGRSVSAQVIRMLTDACEASETEIVTETETEKTEAIQ